MALGTGRLVLQTDSVVGNILIDKNTGNAQGVGYYDRLSKVYREASGRLVVLCASAFESVRILLNSACTQHPEGIGASAGHLGHYISDHVMFRTGGKTSPEFVDAIRATEGDVSPVRRDPYDFGLYSMSLLSGR